MTKKWLDYGSETVVSTGHEVIVYTLAGSLIGMAKSYELQDEVRGHIAGGARRIALDLGGVTKVDSAGLGILASLMWSASQAGASLVLATLPPTVEKMLGIAMLLDRVDRADSREAAIAMLDRA